MRPSCERDEHLITGLVSSRAHEPHPRNIRVVVTGYVIFLPLYDKVIKGRPLQVYFFKGRPFDSHKFDNPN